MSALTTDWAPITAKATMINAAQSGRVNSREEEFLSALGSYLAGYRAHRAATGTASNRGVRKIDFTHVQWLAGWIGLPMA